MLEESSSHALFRAGNEWLNAVMCNGNAAPRINEVAGVAINKGLPYLERVSTSVCPASLVRRLGGGGKVPLPGQHWRRQGCGHPQHQGSGTGFISGQKGLMYKLKLQGSKFDKRDQKSARLSRIYAAPIRQDAITHSVWAA